MGSPSTAGTTSQFPRDTSARHGLWMPHRAWRRRTRELLLRAEFADVRIAVAMKEEVTESISEGVTDGF
jgi:hypothetical protein